MAKKDIDWSNIGFGYIKTDYRYVSNFKDGSWDEGALITDDYDYIKRVCLRITVCSDMLRGLKSIYNRRRSHRDLPSGLKRRAYDELRSKT